MTQGYVVLEGADGCGKSTQAKMLVEHLRAAGRTVQHVREPGSTPLAEGLRDILLRATGREIEPLTEALLFTAARRELVTKVIAPALVRGEVVVAERSFVSTLVYQCRAPREAETRVSEELFTAITRAVHEGTWPAAVVVLDVPVELGQRRLAAQKDRIEQRGAEFARRVRDAFVALPRDAALTSLVGKDGVHVVDASGEREPVHAAVRAACASALAARGER